MKFRPIRAVLVALLAMLVGCAEPHFRYLDGEPGRLADYDGRWLVINFWAPWCAPCREEIPALNRFAAVNPEVAVIGVSFDALPTDELRRLRKEWQIAYPLLRSEPAPLLGLSLPMGLPATWLRSPTGRLIGPLLGAQTEATLSEAIAAEQE